MKMSEKTIDYQIKKDYKMGAIMAEGVMDHLEQIEFTKKYYEEFEVLSERDEGIIGRILKAHLILEHYIDKYLDAAHPGISFEELKLNFSKKITIVCFDKRNALLENGLKTINKIRNKIAHDFDPKITTEELESLGKYSNLVNEAASEIAGRAYQKPEGYDYIESFVDFVCSWLAENVRNIQKRALNTGYKGLEEWWKKRFDQERALYEKGTSTLKEMGISSFQ